MHTNVRVNNSVATGLKVTLSDSGKSVEKNDEAPENDGYNAELDESFMEEEMLELEHPMSKFDRNNKEDDHNTSTTIQFGSLPPVVVNNYIFSMIFHFELDGERGDGEFEVEAEELDEASHEQTIAELASGFAGLDLDGDDEESSVAELVTEFASLALEDEPGSVMMARTGARINLSAETARQHKSS
ncbi:unnamed protein product [Linum trigynum]|uniref:Uncharacterized protein n=1 Tax=Linum trigynum TaxID=586398 RepID=A0AAV2EAW8_9ROSI